MTPEPVHKGAERATESSKGSPARNYAGLGRRWPAEHQNEKEPPN